MFQSLRCHARLLLALGLLLLLAACGGEPVPGVAESLPSTTPSPAPSATAASRPTLQPQPSATAEPTSAGSADTEVSASAEVTNTIKTFIYRPAELTVAPGTRVTWTNEDDIDHSVTHGASPDPGSAFDSGLFALGETFAFTFSEPGTYPYFCTRHPSMQGVVIVE